ncbi:MAG: phosphatidate cytidylyltransferase [Lachnospiraceae bacterium]|nr:phosphatidate cytidylyltransferase [Lachnospiraceae bacterium]
MFKTRLMSSIVLVIVLAFSLLQGDLILWGLLLGISLVGQFEFYRAVKPDEEKENRINCLEFIGYIGTMIYYGLLLLDFDAQRLFLLLIGILIATMFVYVFNYPRFHSSYMMSTVFGVLYIPVMLSFIYLTRMYTDGNYLVWLIFISSWICDTCAYCVGMLIGKHKLAPKLSPKKSIEGAIGGVVGSALVGGLYGYALTQIRSLDFVIIGIFVCIGGIGAVVSQIGDLTASALKRNHSIKDFGNLIPGHGGILDRFDSVIVTAPMIYILAVLFM